MTIRLTAALQALPTGAQLWMQSMGRSMFPFLLSGDRLLVQRCTADDLRLGDIAVLVDDGRRLVAHVVQQTEPLRTSTFLGAVDGAAMSPIARVIALKRFGLRVPLEPRVTWAAHRLASQPTLHAAAHSILDTALLASRPLRREWVKKLDVFWPPSAEISELVSWVAKVDGARSALALEAKKERARVVALRLRKSPVAVAWRTPEGSFTCVTSRWAVDLNLSEQLERALS